ncbi:hypothetical protein LIER_16482 [Lithospermum erythrorhizon]|uniref:Uncharacterized protein n=1 Tax=Lithospermum erythrorhizon TaxID=34254 RepID=A0AAV3Q9B7_LITER
MRKKTIASRCLIALIMMVKCILKTMTWNLISMRTTLKKILLMRLMGLTTYRLLQITRQLQISKELDSSASNLNVTPTVAYPASDTNKIFDGEKSTVQVEVPATPPRVFWHPSDLSVRPVIPAKKSDRTLDAVTSVPFGALPAADFAKMPKQKLDSICNKIVSIIAGNTTIAEKQKCDLSILRQSKASALRAQLASLIGLLIRHSTDISDELANSGMLGALTDGLRDRQEKVRRFSMAALGELLLYISTQNEQGREGNLLESPSKENRQTSGWQVPSSVITLVASLLRHGEDDITQLYALRTIENISSHGGYWATRFSSHDVISSLSYIFRLLESKRVRGLQLHHVWSVRFNLPTIQRVVDKIQLKDIASSLTKVGSLMYAMMCTRPDIAHAVGVVSRYMSNPGREHCKAVKWILRYLMVVLKNPYVS